MPKFQVNQLVETKIEQAGIPAGTVGTVSAIDLGLPNEYVVRFTGVNDRASSYLGADLAPAFPQPSRLVSTVKLDTSIPGYSRVYVELTFDDAPLQSVIIYSGDEWCARDLYSGEMTLSDVHAHYDAKVERSRKREAERKAGK
jgi:hypothetical protein